jgi:ABC-type multidrug transport system fused ATPase/permease subunit
MYRKKLLAFLKDFKNQKRYAKWMLEYSRKYIWSILGLLTLNIVLSLVGIGSSVASKFVIDLATEGKGLTWGIALMVFLTVINIVLGVSSSIFYNLVNEKYSFSIRIKLFDSILNTKWPELTRYRSGDLITRMSSDVGAVTGGITSTVPSIITLLVQLVTAFFVLFHYDSGLALFALISGPIAVAASVVLGAKLKRLQVKVQESESAYNSFLYESVNNIIVIKSFSNEQEYGRKLAELRRERFAWVFKKNLLSVFSGAVISLAFAAGYLAAFVIGAYKIQNQLISFGTMTLFLSMVAQIQSPLMGLGRTMPSLISILASAGRIIEISALSQEDRRTGVFHPEKVGIFLRDVSFTYGNEYILRNVNLEIKAGDTVAITGRTGAGKTTLIKLLLNFITPTVGDISYTDEKGLSEPVNADSRDYIAYIPQGNYLFSGSIADNLRTGKPDATQEEMNEALRCACADDFVGALPEGVNSVIGERGEGLSEGQGQRIAIARALIRKSPLLILDESTSALDEITEYRILQAIQNMKDHPTCLIITHRKAAISICSRHIRVEGDQVIETVCPRSQEEENAERPLT